MSTLFPNGQALLRYLQRLIQQRDLHVLTTQEFIDLVLAAFAEADRVYPDVIPILCASLPDGVRQQFVTSTRDAAQPDYQWHSKYAVEHRNLTNEERRIDSLRRTWRVQEWAFKIVQFLDCPHASAEPKPITHEQVAHNRMIVERIFSFGRVVQDRNPALASILERATIPFLEYPRPLVQAARDELLRVNGIGPVTVDYIRRIIAGEDINAVVADVPKIVPEVQRHPTERTSKDRGNRDGSWDNAEDD